MMIEPRSTATIRALASLAVLSADQLEEGASVEEVIATLRKAAEAVRSVVDADEAAEQQAEDEAAELAQDLTPMDLLSDDDDDGDEDLSISSDEQVLNAS